MVLDARLEVLLPVVEEGLVWAEDVRGRVAVTSMVRFTGRGRVALLRVEGVGAGRVGTGFADAGAVGLPDRPLEDRDDVRAGGDAGVGVDGRSWTVRDEDERDGLDCAGVDRCGGDCLADCRGWGGGADRGALGGDEGRVDCAALGADLACDRPLDSELYSARLLRAIAGAASSEPNNIIPVTKTNCL
ncbi:MAG: hypothetical protein ABFR90_01185 [Planctomycetota bacterium]